MYKKYTFRVTVERLLHHKSRTVGTPGVNLVSKLRETRGEKVMKEEREILSGIDAPLKKRQGGGGGHYGPPPPR